MSTADEACLLCDMEHVDPERVVFRDELWSAEVVPGYEVRGWYVLRARRHAETIVGLDDVELASFAYRARDLVAAVGTVTSAPAVYLMVFGERYAHFHVLVTARGDDVDASRRTGDILKLRTEQADLAAALELVPSIRRAYGAVLDREARAGVAR